MLETENLQNLLLGAAEEGRDLKYLFHDLGQKKRVADVGQGITHPRLQPRCRGLPLLLRWKRRVGA